MPEEKYGDIDVNPIETRIDTKIDSTKHSDLNHDSNFAQAIEAASALISLPLREAMIVYFPKR